MTLWNMSLLHNDELLIAILSINFTGYNKCKCLYYSAVLKYVNCNNFGFGKLAGSLLNIEFSLGYKPGIIIGPKNRMVEDYSKVIDVE
ncbi:10560_t:CDS:2, partial [Gigaspora rosea]